MNPRYINFFRAWYWKFHHRCKKNLYMHRIYLEEKLPVQKVYSKTDHSVPLQANLTLTLKKERTIHHPKSAWSPATKQGWSGAAWGGCSGQTPNSEPCGRNPFPGYVSSLPIAPDVWSTVWTEYQAQLLESWVIPPAWTLTPGVFTTASGVPGTASWNAGLSLQVN